MNKLPLPTRGPVHIGLAALISLFGCVAAWPAELNVTVRDLQGAPVGGVAVYAVPDTPVTHTSTAATQIQQVDSQFVPHLSVIQTGTSVTFPNRDSVSHHVYSFSAAKRFQLPLYRGTAHQPVQFDIPGVAVLGCNIHDDMLAYVLVVETPHYGVTNGKGEVRLNLATANAARVEIWSPRVKHPPAAQSIALQAAASANVTFTLDKPLTPAHHTDTESLSWGDY